MNLKHILKNEIIYIYIYIGPGREDREADGPPD